MTYLDPEIEAELQRMKRDLNISGNRNNQSNAISKSESLETLYNYSKR